MYLLNKLIPKYSNLPSLIKGFVRMLKSVPIFVFLVVVLSNPIYIQQTRAAFPERNYEERSHQSASPKINPDLDGITLSWESPEFHLEPLPNGATKISAVGFDSLTQPGYPQIPVESLLIAIPGDSEPSLDVISIEEKTQSLNYSVLVTSMPDGVIRGPSGEILEPTTTPLSQPIFAVNSPLALELIGVMRGVQLARLSFYPVQIQGNELIHTRYIEARISYNQSKDISYPAESKSADPMLMMLKDLVINPTEIIPSERTRLSQPTTPNAVSEVLIIEVVQSGLTELTFQSLTEVGFPVTQINPHNLELSHHGEQVAMEWEGDGDNHFEAGERLLFYADFVTNRWSKFDTYLLSESDSAGLRMNNRSADPNGILIGDAYVRQLFEENLYYSPNCYCGSTPLARDGDRWVWNDLDISKPDTTFRRYYSDIAHVDASLPGVLTIWLIGYTDTIHTIDHRVEVFLNGTRLGQVEWNGKTAVQSQFDLPSGLLETEDNELALNLPGISGVSKEGVWLDAYQIQYGLQNVSLGEGLIFSGEQIPRAYNFALASSTGLRAYQITQPKQPIRLTDVQINSNTIAFRDPTGMGPQDYIAVTENGIHTPTRLRIKETLPEVGSGGFTGAEYVLISHTNFISSISPLVNYRQNQGLSTHVQDVQPIFDNLSDGIPSPEAIRDYLQEAYLNWPIRPVYVLLIGDGTYDPKHYETSSSDTFIPPYLADVDPWAGETAADNRFVTIDGSDNLPDLYLGRLPVNSTEETTTILQKIMAYENGSAVGPWAEKAVFIADNADVAGDFHANSDTLANYVQSPFSPDKIYYIDGTPPADTRTEIIRSLNYGSGISVYSGHSSVHQWAIENLFHYNDISGLTNGNKSPVLVEATCFTSFYHLPDMSALDESFIRKANGGAVAVWGPSGLGLPDGHLKLVEGFIQNVYQLNQRNLGQAIQAGRLNLATHAPAYAALIDTQTLLGDPAMTLMFSTTDANNRLYLPFVER